MSAGNHTIDKFGRSSSIKKLSVIRCRGPPGIGFRLSSDKNYDIQGKLLKNVGEPQDTQDGATRGYVDTHITDCVQDTHKAVQNAADSITETFTKHIEEVKQNVIEECKEKTNVRERELTKSMMTYIDKKLLEYKTVNGMHNRSLADKITKLEQLNIAENKVLVDRISRLEQPKHPSRGRLAPPPYMEPTREIKI